MATETQVLARMVERAREQTLYYLHKLEGQDPHHRPLADGVPLNSAFWIVAHLAVTENWLLHRGTGGELLRFTWAKHFNMGVPPPDAGSLPAWDEVLATFHEVHRRAMDRVQQLSEAELEAPHQALLKLGGAEQVRDVVMHAIRHEALHAGQLAWHARIRGIRTR